MYDGERVVGVEIEEDGKKSYVKGERGVILCAGGFGMNRDLIKAYLPSAYEGTVQGGPMAYHTGEAFRMGLGLGADFAGFDSWSCWEAAIDEETAGGDGQFWHYFWHGERQLFHNPWLVIDKRGRRQPYFAQTQELFANPGGQMGDLSNCAAWMSAVGHRVYSICDSDFATNIFEKNVLLPTQSDRNRIPLTDPDVLIDTKGLVTADWLAEVDEAVARGAVKKADTIEELADMLLLDRDVLKSAVDEYNEVCEKGVDDQLSTPYDPSWLHAIKNPPFYGAILGGQMAKTMCGLRTDERLQVMREDRLAHRRPLRKRHHRRRAVRRGELRLFLELHRLRWRGHKLDHRLHRRQVALGKRLLTIRETPTPAAPRTQSSSPARARGAAIARLRCGRIPRAAARVRWWRLLDRPCTTADHHGLRTAKP